jgi:RNA polymerase sigma-70 factor, ECF subfamily
MGRRASERTPDGFADAELLAGMRAGNSAAFAALMRTNNQRLYRLARGFLRDDLEAEEAVHDGYVRAFTHLNGFRGGSSLATWLARIVSNEALGRLRRQRPTVDISELEETLAADARPFTTAPPTPEQAIARREIRNAIEKAVDQLPPYFRSVFMLRAIEQMSVEERASCLGIPSDTVKTRFHRANKLLRQLLTTQFGAVFDDVYPFLGTRCDRLVATVLQRIGLSTETGFSVPECDRPAPCHSSL